MTGIRLEKNKTLRPSCVEFRFPSRVSRGFPGVLQLRTTKVEAAFSSVNNGGHSSDAAVLSELGNISSLKRSKERHERLFSGPD